MIKNKHYIAAVLCTPTLAEWLKAAALYGEAVMLSCGGVLDYAYARCCDRFIGATLAQLVEQLIRNQQVVGSNPTGGSNEIKGFFLSQIL
jgi:hypothetical protein